MNQNRLMDTIDPSDTFDTIREWPVGPTDYTGEIPAPTHQTKETTMPDEDTTFTSEEFDADGVFSLALSATDYGTVMQALAERGTLEPVTGRAKILGQRLQDWNHTDMWANSWANR
jgi:hypothetical protein